MELDGIGWYGLHSGVRSCWAFPVTENAQDGIRVAIIQKHPGKYEKKRDVGSGGSSVLNFF